MQPPRGASVRRIAASFGNGVRRLRLERAGPVAVAAAAALAALLGLAVILLGGALAGGRSDAVGQVAAGRSSPAPEQPAERLVNENFDALEIGVPLDDRWTVAPGRSNAAVVPLPTAVDRSLQLTVTAAGQPVSVCRGFQAVRQDVIGASAEIGLDMAPAAAATLMALGRGGSQAVAIHMAEDGALSYPYANAVLPAGVSIEPGEVYRLSVTVDLADRTYGWSLESGDELLFARASIAVASSFSTPLDGVCLTAPGEPVALNVYLDDLVVEASR